MTKLTQEYWTERYQKAQTGWDIGYASTPIQEYIDQLKDSSLRILIPGAGNAYEAEYLHSKGFSEVYVVDLSAEPLENLKKRCPGFPESHLIQGDFFEMKPDEPYDLIIEQTFFCAISPHLRPQYVAKMKALLKPKGKLTGLFFANSLLDRKDPPYGEKAEVIRAYFEKDFEIEIFEPAYNSIPPRKGSEYFFQFIRPE